LWYATTVITNYQKREGKTKTTAPEGAILTDTLDKLITAATNLKKDTAEEGYWGFNGKLCKDYYDFVRTDIQQYNASYISGYDRLP
jgi:hypothetical protein